MDDRPLDPALTFATFVVGPSNRRAYGEAVAVATRVGAANPLFVHGGPGVGKTHLLNALALVRQRDMPSRVVHVGAGDLLDEIVRHVRAQTVDRLLGELGALQMLVVDDAQFFAGRIESQRVLLRIVDMLRQQGGQLVAAADRRPEGIFGLYRLSDRLACGRVIELPAPDAATALRIVVRRARHHLIRLPHRVAALIALNVGASVRELEGAVTRIAAHATLSGREITVELARDILAAFKAAPVRRDAARPVAPIIAQPPPIVVPPPAALPPRPPVHQEERQPPRGRRRKRQRPSGPPGDLAAGIAELREFVREVGGDRIGEPEVDGRVVYVPMLDRGGERFILRVTIGNYLVAPPACTFVDEAHRETAAAWPANEVHGPFRSPDFICTPPTKEFFTCHTERTYRYGDGSLVNTVGTIYAALAAHRSGRHGRRNRDRLNAAGF